MELIRLIEAESFKVSGYKFLSFNKKGIETTAYYVHNDKYQEGIGLSIYTANREVTISATSYNLFYDKNRNFEEAFIAGNGGLVEEERQACMSLLEQACKAMPKDYTINFSANVTRHLF